jgi:hypothetical protein
MTEIGMALGNPYEGPRHPACVGAPFRGVEVKVGLFEGAAAAETVVHLRGLTLRWGDIRLDCG